MFSSHLSLLVLFSLLIFININIYIHTVIMMKLLRSGGPFSSALDLQQDGHFNIIHY